MLMIDEYHIIVHDCSKNSLNFLPFVEAPGYPALDDTQSLLCLDLVEYSAKIAGTVKNICMV